MGGSSWNSRGSHGNTHPKLDSSSLPRGWGCHLFELPGNRSRENCCPCWAQRPGGQSLGALCTCSPRSAPERRLLVPNREEGPPPKFLASCGVAPGREGTPVTLFLIFGVVVVGGGGSPPPRPIRKEQTRQVLGGIAAQRGHTLNSRVSVSMCGAHSVRWRAKHATEDERARVHADIAHITARFDD